MWFSGALGILRCVVQPFVGGTFGGWEDTSLLPVDGILTVECGLDCAGISTLYQSVQIPFCFC